MIVAAVAVVIALSQVANLPRTFLNGRAAKLMECETIDPRICGTTTTT